MTPEEYSAAMATITSAVAAYVQRFAGLFTGPVLATAEWLRFLQVLFPEVKSRYAEAADLGRSFYDSQRALHHPELPRNERLRSDLQWDWFVKNMQPARNGMSQADSPKSAVTSMALTAAREVEMAPRRQIIGAVKNDPAPQTVQGWARVATGRETCAWCLMLISRGAEVNHKGNLAYREASSGGLLLDDETAIDLWNEAGQDLDAFREATKDDIEKWHTGCDCLVVPVFDVMNWPGRESALKAQELWIEASIEAHELISSGKARSSNLNREAQNALRRRLASGEVTMSSYALAA